MSINVSLESALQSCNCGSLRRAARRVTQMYDEALEPVSLRATQFTLLSVVRGQRGLSVKDLGAALELDRTTTGKNLQPLERMGLVQVTQSPVDARSRLVALTPAGLEILKRADVLWQQAQRAFEEANGKAKAAELRHLLASLA